MFTDQQCHIRSSFQITFLTIHTFTSRMTSIRSWTLRLQLMQMISVQRILLLQMCEYLTTTHCFSSSLSDVTNVYMCNTLLRVLESETSRRCVLQRSFIKEPVSQTAPGKVHISVSAITLRILIPVLFDPSHNI